MHIRNNETNQSRTTSGNVTLLPETHNNNSNNQNHHHTHPGPPTGRPRGQLSRTPAIVSVSPDMVGAFQDHRQPINVPTYTNRNHVHQEAVSHNHASPAILHSAAAPPMPSHHQPRRNSSHTISVSSENMLVPPHPHQPAPGDGQQGRRLTAPFIKSRSIECGMLGSVDKNMRNLLLLNNEKLYPKNDRISINVCGKVFETSVKDLNKYPNTLLGNQEKRREYYDIFRDELYFNRNQTAFDAILYFYQSGGDIYQPEGLPDIVFERELEFFGLIDDTIEVAVDSPEPEITHSQIISQPNSNAFLKWRTALWCFLEYPKSSFPARIWASTNIFIIVISVINLIWESLPKYRNSPSIIFFIVDTICVSYFTLDLVLRVLSTPSLKVFMRNILNWFDFLAIVPFYVELLIGRENASGLAAFRILRLFRITRLFKLIRHSSRMMLMLEVVSNCLSELIMLFLTWIMGTLIFGTIMFYIEESETSDFKSILHACWWAAVTMTTVGYGDLYPETPLGQSVGSTILFLSMIYIALPMTLIVSKFSTTLAAHQETHAERRRKYKKIPHRKKSASFF